MAAKKKEELIEESALSSSQSTLFAILKENKKEHLNFEETVHWKSSFGSLMMDYASGGVRPGVLRLCGASGGGKTPTALEIIRNVFKDVGNSKALWIISEGRPPSEQNQVRCGLKFVYKPEDWEIGTIFILESNIYELFIKMVKELVLNNPENIRYVFVLDSLNGLITRGDASKDIEENTMVAGQAVLSKKMLQSLSLGCTKFGHLIIPISQVTAEIKLEKYAKTVDRGGEMSGGNAMIHASNSIINFERPNAGDFILDPPSGRFNDGKTKTIGQNIRVTFNKTAVEASKKMTITYPILYGRRPSGIWREREVGDLLIMWEMLSKSGSWFSFKEDVILSAEKEGIVISANKIQGMDSIYKYLEENPKVCDYFYALFLKMMTA
jgi:RecA/RadA recombinase